MTEILNPASIPETVKANPFGEVTQAQLEELAYFQQRYKEERERRLRPDGLKQYSNVATSERFKKFWEDPWVVRGAPIHTPVPDGGHVKLLILGAGAGGLLQAVQCIKAGMKADDICIVDVAGGFGGAWYWNRYPGIACDTETYCYMPMLEEMDYMPSKKFAPGEEFRLHYERIATKYDLQQRAMWQTWSNTATWNAGKMQWDIELTQKPKGGPEKEMTVHADFVVLAAGLQSVPKMPNLEGIEHYKGHMFHTSRWDYEYSGGSAADQQLWGLVGKKVGLIGNAASGSQAIVEISKFASEVYMFQRTPARVHTKPNPYTDVTAWKTTIANKPGWQAERNRNLNAYVNYSPNKPETDQINDSHTQLVTFCANFGTPRTITPELLPHWIQHLNLIEIPLLKGVHERVDKAITDPELAKKLKAWFPVWCKRSIFSDDYLPTLNRPNVHVIDTDGKGVEKITQNGVVVGGHEYPVDVIIMGTGFQSPWGSPAEKVNMSITGVDGLPMAQKWKTGMTTLHGVVSRGFPNLFWGGPMQSSISPANTFVLDGLAEHIAYIIMQSCQKAGSRGKVMIQPSNAAEEAWGGRVASMMLGFAAVQGCTPSLSNGEGELERLRDSLPPEVKAKMARLGMWGRGVDDYLTVLREWRAKDDLEGLDLEVNTV